MKHRRPEKILIAVFILGFSSAIAAQNKDLEAAQKYMADKQRNEAKMQEFINYAVKGDVGGMLSMITPDALKRNDTKARKELVNKFTRTYLKITL